MKNRRAPLQGLRAAQWMAVSLGALLALGASSPAVAQPLTWEQCLREAAERNAELSTARSNLEAARSRARAAYSGYLPQISAGASRSDSSGDNLSGTVPDYSASVSLSQNLFTGFQDEARVEREHANVEVTDAAYVNARARLSSDLKGAFAGLLFAQNNVELAASIVRRREENLRLVELRFEGGRENKGAYLLTRAALAQARLDLLQARQALGSAGQELARVLGRESAEELRASGAVPLTEPETAPAFAQLAREAPDYRQAAAQESGAQADVKLARGGYYPSLSLTGTTAREGPDWFPDSERRIVSLSVSIPLYSGGRDYYGVQGASQSLAAAESNKASVERQLLVRLRQAHASYVEAVERVKVDREFLEAAELRAEIARARYGNGLLSFDEWDRIENDLILRQNAFLQSQRNRVTAEAAWELVQGKSAIP
jgi:outer membrane protein TolC